MIGFNRLISFDGLTSYVACDVVGGVAVLKIGGSSEIEVGEKKVGPARSHTG